jgi:hypothetical protein
VTVLRPRHHYKEFEGRSHYTDYALEWAVEHASCNQLEGLNSTCWGTNRRFRPVIVARVQRELYELLLDGYRRTGGAARLDVDRLVGS